MVEGLTMQLGRGKIVDHHQTLGLLTFKKRWTYILTEIKIQFLDQPKFILTKK